MMSEETAGLIFGVLWALIGYGFGVPKGRGVLGAVLGFLFWGFGLIAVFLLPMSPQMRAWRAAVAAADDKPVADWYDDPRGRHEYRYFDGTKWTLNVADDGVASVESGHV